MRGSFCLAIATLSLTGSALMVTGTTGGTFCRFSHQPAARGEEAVSAEGLCSPKVSSLFLSRFLGDLFFPLFFKAYSHDGLYAMCLPIPSRSNSGELVKPSYLADYVRTCGGKHHSRSWSKPIQHLKVAVWHHCGFSRLLWQAMS